MTVKFTVVNDSDEIPDLEIQAPMVPRHGETVTMQGRNYVVIEVKHDFDSDKTFVTIAR